MLQVSGIWIVDSNGNRIELRGAGGDYTAYENPTNLATEITWMQETGLNLVRLGFVFPDTGGWSEGDNSGTSVYSTSSMQSVVAQFWAHGIYCDLQDADDWATVADQGVNEIIPLYNATWISDWVGVSNDFKNNPAVAMYELTNEPYDTNGNNTGIMRQLYDNCISAIRANGDNHICLCWDGDFQASSQVLYSNMAFDEHDWFSYGSEKSVEGAGGYNLFPEDTGSNSRNFIAAELEASEAIGDIVASRSTLQAPVFLGEFGVYNYSMSSPDVLNNAYEIYLCEQYGIPWITWSLDGWISGQYNTYSGGQTGATYWTTFCNTMLGGAFT